MNCIEKQFELHKACEPCVAKIIDFEQLPEHEKFNYDFYEKEKDYIVCCEKCNFYNLLSSEKNETNRN